MYETKSNCVPKYRSRTLHGNAFHCVPKYCSIKLPKHFVILKIFKITNEFFFINFSKSVVLILHYQL